MGKNVRFSIFSTIGLAILEYAFVLVSILQCNSVLYRDGNGDGNKIQFLWIILLFALGVYGVWELGIRKSNLLPLIKFIVVYILVYIPFLVINYQRNAFSVGAVVLYLIIPIIGTIYFYSAIKMCRGEVLLLRMKNVILILAMISLFFWILSLIGVPTNSLTWITWGSTPHYVSGYFNIHYITQGATEFLGINSIRNTGIFVEAPMYSYILSLGMLISFFVDRTKSLVTRERILLFITALSTTSTTGIITIILILVYYAIFLINNISKGVKITLCILIVPVGAILVRLILLDKVDSNWASSSSIRANDFYAGFMAWKDHKFLGNGIDNYQSIMQYMDYRRLQFNQNSGFSSGMMKVLAYGGILNFLIYLIPTVSTFKVSKKMLGFGIISFILFAVTLVNNVYIYLVILCYFGASYLLRNENKSLEA